MEIAALYELFQQHPQITTDSRNCPKGSIFFALKGASFNGNAFAAKKDLIIFVACSKDGTINILFIIKNLNDTII